jgi:hypothetical protein
VDLPELGTANPSTYIATILAHEIGHCIGFRHTDYDTRVSCWPLVGNEDRGVPPSERAIHIPGTPVNPDFTSWMLACPVARGENRPFNANDVRALRYLY